MFAFKRNQVIITSLVVMIAVAGYLNHIENTATANQITLDDKGTIPASSNEPEVIDVSSIKGVSVEELKAEQNAAINSDIEIDEDIEMTATSSASSDSLQEDTMFTSDTEEATQPGEAVFINQTSTTSTDQYFASAKLEREQTRADEKDMLIEVMNNENVAQETKDESAEQMIELQKRIEKENATEAMLDAKGFGPCYVRIDDTTVDVIVSKENLSEAEIAQIEDIVTRKTGMESSQIRISTIK